MTGPMTPEELEKLNELMKPFLDRGVELAQERLMASVASGTDRDKSNQLIIEQMAALHFLGQQIASSVIQGENTLSELIRMFSNNLLKESEGLLQHMAKNPDDCIYTTLDPDKGQDLAIVKDKD